MPSFLIKVYTDDEGNEIGKQYIFEELPSNGGGNGGTDPLPVGPRVLTTVVPQFMATPTVNDDGSLRIQPELGANDKNYLFAQYEKLPVKFDIGAGSAPLDGFQVELTVQMFSAEFASGHDGKQRSYSFVLPQEIVPLGTPMDYGAGHLYLAGGSHKYAVVPKWTMRDPNRPKIIFHVGNSEWGTDSPKNANGLEVRLHFGIVYKWVVG